MNTPSSAVESVLFEGFFDIPEEPKLPETPPTLQDAAEALAPEKIEVVEKAETPATQWSNILLSLKETDKLLPEDLEIPLDLTPEKMKEVLYSTIEKQVLAKTSPDIESLREQEYAKLYEKGYTAEQIERALPYSEHLAEGGSEEVVSRHALLDVLASTPLENPDDKILVVRRFMELKGQEPDLIDTHLQTKFKFTGDEDEDLAVIRELDKAVKVAQDGIGKIRDAEWAEDQRAAKERQDASKQLRVEERTMIRKAIDEGLYGIKFTKKEADDLENQMFTAITFRNAQTPNGIQRIGETQEMKAWREIQADPKKRAAMAYIAINGIDKVINAAAKQGSDKFMQSIEKEPLAPSPIRDLPPIKQGQGFILPV